MYSSSSINSATGNISFGSNNLTTTGNVNAANIFNLQSTVDSQQTEIDTLQSVVGNIQSSQWTTNPDGSIGFNGNVWVNLWQN